MQLEQRLEMYTQPMQGKTSVSNKRQRSYVSRDLESLSASPLYTGELQNGAADWRGSMYNIFGNDFHIGGSAFGRIKEKSIIETMKEQAEKHSREVAEQRRVREEKANADRLDMLMADRERQLTITNLPESGVQLHTHERPGGTTHIKYKDGTYTEINSYDAAIADLSATKFSLPKYLRNTGFKFKLPEEE